MKLPFAFGINLIFRLVFPGLVLALVIAFQVAELKMPGRASLPDLGEGAMIGMLTVFFGWLITLADMPIYMLFEGRRFWPRRLRSWMRRREQARLRRLEAEADAHWQRVQELRAELRDEQRRDRQDALALEHSEAFERHLERAIQASRFPLNDRGERHAPMPTRLGNLIYEYELYPSSKYGLDAIFFYYRLWLTIDEDLREEIDAKQAVVDGATYVSFACLVGALICVLGAGLDVLGIGLGRPLEFAAVGIDLALAAGLLILARLVYRLSIHGHLQFGEIFKALFDQHWHKLELAPTLKLIEQKTGRPSPPENDQPERAQTAWRYLRWHRVRVDGVNVNVEKLRRTNCARASP